MDNNTAPQKSQLPEKPVTTPAYTDSQESFLIGSQMPPEKRSFNFKKYILYAALALLLLISIPIINHYVQDNQAQQAYEAAQKRCGRSNPIVISDRIVGFSGETNGITVYDGPNVGDAGEKYYCTLTEAVNDGYSREQLNREASEEIKNLYP